MHIDDIPRIIFEHNAEIGQVITALAGAGAE
jgi:hypothetical protein